MALGMKAVNEAQLNGELFESTTRHRRAVLSHSRFSSGDCVAANRRILRLLKAHLCCVFVMTNVAAALICCV